MYTTVDEIDAPIGSIDALIGGIDAMIGGIDATFLLAWHTFRVLSTVFTSRCLGKTSINCCHYVIST